MRRECICVLVIAAALFAAPGAHAAGLRAGVAPVDATWHVGASAGQYASDGSFAGEHGLDPTAHSTRRSSSYGIQSRLDVRALVVEGPGGERIALVKNDLYIPQDLLWRRTAQLLEAGGSGITRETLTIAATHNHSSPYYSSTSWACGRSRTSSTCASTTTTRAAWPRRWSAPRRRWSRCASGRR